MSVELIKYAFSAGELSPTLYGRTDLTKYDLGLALTKNWFIDYRGGLTSRFGTEFCDYIKDDDKNVILREFQFSPDLTETYVVMFGHNYIRFIQDGGYVLTGAQSLTSIDTTGGVVTVTKVAHGLTNGTWIKLDGTSGVTGLNGHTFVVGSATADTFQLLDPRSGTAINRTGETAVGGGTIYKIYEIASPYASVDLPDLKVSQIRDYMRMTHPNYSIRNLNRVDHDNWNTSIESIGGVAYSATTWGLTVTGPAPGTAAAMTVIYAVAAVFEDGSESTASHPVRSAVTKNFSIEQGFMRVAWNVIPGAVEYVLYRSNIVVYDSTATPPQKAPAGSQLGFVARTKATYFVDSNIIPDFTKAPYTHYAPFNPGAIESVTITNGGTGYDFYASVTITDGSGAHGFVGYAVADETGVLTSVVILNRGKNFVAPLTVAIGGSGTSATATATIGPTTGMYPRVSTVFQQRQLYAASLQHPLTLWASQIGRFNVFDTSPFLIESDSYEFEVDAAQIAPLLHFKPLRGGLLMLSQTGIWLLSGGQGQAVTPTNALADPQSYTGVSKVPPLQVGSDLLYIEGKGYSVRLLTYNDFSKVYSGEDKSILSNHLFTKDKQITGWGFAENPYKLVLGVRSDGILTMFTTVKEQEVYAWTWGQTRGWFREILVVQENGIDSPYVIVERVIGGQRCKYLERFIIDEWQHVEDSFCVDSGLRVDPAPAAVTLDISASYVSGDATYVTLTAGAATFTGTVGNWVRAAGGIFVITAVTSSTVATAKVMEPAADVIPEDPLHRVAQQASGTWSIAVPVKTFSGLQHLEGEQVSILGDGSVFPPQIVTNGKITLTDGVSKVRAGMGYECVAQTLPPTVQDQPIEARRKRIVGIAVRMHRARGLLVGRTLDNLYPIRERTNEPYGSPTLTFNGYKYQLLETDWNEDAQTYLVQDNPLPASVLGLVPDLEVGDDTN